MFKDYPELTEKIISTHFNKFSHDFSKDIIKEPQATFMIPLIDSYFDMEKYVFIIRNPFDNIRSILNRLQIPGDLDEINLEDVNHRWRGKFKRGGPNYIKDLAELWLEANSQDKYMYNSRCHLVKYEDFMKNKIIFIEKLVNNLNLHKINDIKQFADIQFQPKGNSNTDLLMFFGMKNIKLIHDICGEKMMTFGYQKERIFKNNINDKRYKTVFTT